MLRFLIRENAFEFEEGDMPFPPQAARVFLGRDVRKVPRNLPRKQSAYPPDRAWAVAGCPLHAQEAGDAGIIEQCLQPEPHLRQSEYKTRKSCMSKDMWL